jgi:hypothetical protein
LNFNIFVFKALFVFLKHTHIQLYSYFFQVLEGKETGKFFGPVEFSTKNKGVVEKKFIHI